MYIVQTIENGIRLYYQILEKYNLKKLYKAVLSYTTRDEIKSKIMSDTYARIILDVYMTPEEFAEIVRKFSDKEFQISFE